MWNIKERHLEIKTSLFTTSILLKGEPGFLSSNNWAQANALDPKHRWRTTALAPEGRERTVGSERQGTQGAPEPWAHLTHCSDPSSSSLERESGERWGSSYGAQWELTPSRSNMRKTN